MLVKSCYLTAACEQSLCEQFFFVTMVSDMCHDHLAMYLWALIRDCCILCT